MAALVHFLQLLTRIPTPLRGLVLLLLLLLPWLLLWLLLLLLLLLLLALQRLLWRHSALPRPGCCPPAQHGRYLAGFAGHRQAWQLYARSRQGRGLLLLLLLLLGRRCACLSLGGGQAGRRLRGLLLCLRPWQALLRGWLWRQRRWLGCLPCPCLLCGRRLRCLVDTVR